MITSTTNKVQGTGNGVATNVTFNKRVFSSSHLQVTTEVIATGVKTLQTENGAGTYDYTVTIAALFASATVTWNTALPATHRYTIERVIPLDQQADYVEGDPFPAETTEDALDRLTMMVQQLNDRLSLCLQIDTASAVTLANPSLPDPSDGLFLRWNAAEDAIENVDVTTISGVAAGVDEASTDTGKNKLTSNYLTKRAEDLVAAILAGTQGQGLFKGAASYEMGNRSGTITPAAGAYTVLAADQGKLHILIGASAAKTLPSAATVGAGFLVGFKHAGTSVTHVYTLEGNSSETIDGATTRVMSINGETIWLVSDGTNWQIASVSGTVSRSGYVSVVAPSSYAVLQANQGKLHVISSTSGTLVLPAVATVGAGFLVGFKHAGTSVTHVYTLDGNSSETIDGATTRVMSINGETIWLVSDGTNWQIANVSGPVFRQYQSATPANFTYGPFRLECGKTSHVPNGSVVYVDIAVTFGTAFNVVLGCALSMDGVGSGSIANHASIDSHSLSTTGVTLRCVSRDGTSNLTANTYMGTWLAWGY